MPEISRFFGIVIQMYFDDHQPPALRLVRAWARRHEVELVANWNSIRAGGEGHSIEPLE